MSDSTLSTLPRSAQTVIVGGGAIGCSVALHLAELGHTDVLLLEQAELTAGTTWHAAGLVGALRSSSAITEMARHSREIYSRFESESEFQPGYQQCGGLWLARTQDRLISFRRSVVSARAAGVEAFEVSPSEAEDLWPMLEAESVLGGLWIPGEGKVNPTDLTQAFARRATARGVTIRQGVKLTAIHKRRGQITGVSTSHGDVECDLLVNAAGQWAPVIGSMADVDVPLHPMENIYVVTDRHPDIPVEMPNIRDADAFVYHKGESGAIVVGGLAADNARPWVAPHDIPEPFAFQLLPDRWEPVETMFAAASQVAPTLESVGIRKLYNGPESYTVDHNFLMGKPRGVRGMFVVAGMNGSGIGLAGGVGRAAAEWIVSGEAQFDCRGVDINRFAPAQANLSWVRNRTHETVPAHFDIAWPDKPHRTGRGLRVSPIHERLVRAGATFDEVSGWEIPKYFNEPDADLTAEWRRWGAPAWLDRAMGEAASFSRGAGLYDDSSMGKYVVVGPESASFLRGLTGQDLILEINELAAAWLLNSSGGIDSSATVIRTDDAEYLVLVPCQTAAAFSAQLGEASSHDPSLQVVDVTSSFGLFRLIGPAAGDALSRSAGRSIGPAAGSLTVPRIDVGMARGRLAYVREYDEWWVLVPSEAAGAALESLLSENPDGEDVGLCGFEALRSRHVCMGLGMAGVDYGPDDSPAMLWNGQPPLEADGSRLMRPPRRRLVRARFGTPKEWPWKGQPVLRDQVQVGALSSAVSDPTNGGHAALVWVNLPEDQPEPDAWLGTGRWTLFSPEEDIRLRVLSQDEGEGAET